MLSFPCFTTAGQAAAAATLLIVKNGMMTTFASVYHLGFSGSSHSPPYLLLICNSSPLRDSFHLTSFTPLCLLLDGYILSVLYSILYLLLSTLLFGSLIITIEMKHRYGLKRLRQIQRYGSHMLLHIHLRSLTLLFVSALLTVSGIVPLTSNSLANYQVLVFKACRMMKSSSNKIYFFLLTNSLSKLFPSTEN